jgi:hypothetical protein
MQTMIVALTISLSTVGCHHRSCGGHASGGACYGGYAASGGGYNGGQYASGYGYGSGVYAQGYSPGWARPRGFASRFFGNARSGQMMSNQPVQGYTAPGNGYAYGNAMTTYGYGTPNQAYSAPRYTSPNYVTPGSTTYSSSYGAPVSGSYPGTYTTPTTGGTTNAAPAYTTPESMPGRAVGVPGMNQAPASSATGVNPPVNQPGTVAPSPSTTSPAPPAPTIPGRNP